MLKKRSCSWAPVKSHLIASFSVTLFSLRHCLIKLEPHCSPARLQKQKTGGWVGTPLLQLCASPTPSSSSTAGTPWCSPGSVPSQPLGHSTGRHGRGTVPISGALLQQGHPQYTTLHHKPSCKVLPYPQEDYFPSLQVILVDLVVQNSKAKQGIGDSTKTTKIPTSLQSRLSSASFFVTKLRSLHLMWDSGARQQYKKARLDVCLVAAQSP